MPEQRNPCETFSVKPVLDRLGYEALPEDIRTLADKNYKLLKDNPRHPSLHFKKVGRVWSVRVGINHRAIATEIEDGFLWIWIGTHTEYDKLIA